MGHVAPVPPAPGQESVWDYPRPAVLRPFTGILRVGLAGHLVAETTKGLRVLETSHPPSYYLPPNACDERLFSRGSGRSFCEWKGEARYWTVTVADATVENGSWAYPHPTADFAPLADHRAFYPHLFDCFVDGEPARPQAGGFYGGWITDQVVGPFKGEPGTRGW